VPEAMKQAPRFSAAEQLARAANGGPEDMGVPLAGAEAVPAIAAPDGIMESMRPKERRLEEIPLDEIHPNAIGQTREKFDEDKLQRLAQNIKAHGVSEPIIVRPDPAGGYEIAAGERRWRASRIAGRMTIPCIIRRDLVGNDTEALLTQVGENLHRESLNVVEEARALAAIIEKTGYDVKEAGEEMGKTVQQAYMLLRIHDGPMPVKVRLTKGSIDLRAASEFIRIYNCYAKEDAAKALTKLEKVMDRAEAEGWPVRRLEAFARELKNGPKKKAAPATKESGASVIPSPPGAPTVAGAAGQGVASAADTSPGGSLFTLVEGDRLVINLTLVKGGAMAVDERVELIRIVDEILTDLRRR
jgi:ParB family chromosome partitioning protein